MESPIGQKSFPPNIHTSVAFCIHLMGKSLLGVYKLARKLANLKFKIGANRTSHCVDLHIVIVIKITLKLLKNIINKETNK